ncbi:MAG TPA: hypothetical protein VFA27_07155 [Vicinamibacterales bacterium]|nr:hypothetical protein [Vicinamibacterales bacterium]
MVALSVLLSLTAPSLAMAVDSRGAAYFGGTAVAFKEAKNPVEGLLDTKSDDALVFRAEGKPFKGQVLSVPYAQIIDLEYGQKAGRRVGAAVATTVLLGPIGLLTLLSKKRNHFLTIGYKDGDGKDQVAVIELGKDIVRTTLPIVETRSGKKVEYQDEEARKSAR